MRREPSTARLGRKEGFFSSTVVFNSLFEFSRLVNYTCDFVTWQVSYLGDWGNEGGTGM